MKVTDKSIVTLKPLKRAILNSEQQEIITRAGENLNLQRLILFSNNDDSHTHLGHFFVSSTFNNHMTRTYDFEYTPENLYERIIKTLAGLKTKIDTGNVLDKKGIQAPKTLQEAYKILGIDIGESETFSSFCSQAVNSLLHISAKDENELGHGAFGKVFSIPNVRDFVVKIQHRYKRNILGGEEIHAISDIAPSKNFGQSIAQNEDGTINILKFVKGEEVSIPNYIEKVIDHDKITEEDIAMFKRKLLDLADLPEESYIELCKNIKYINNNMEGYTLDFLNPNNVLFDKKEQKISIVDLGEDAELPKKLKGYKAGAENIIGLICDFNLQPVILERLDTKGQQEIINATKTIISKILRASKTVDLGESSYPAHIIYSVIDKSAEKKLHTQMNFCDSFKKFTDLYPELSIFI